MYPAKPLYAKVVMNMLIAILTSASVLGNGFVLAVLVRFKSLRTVPNILVGNLALVDLLNAVMNLPFHMMSISEVSWFRGKTLAIIAVLIHRVFITLNLTSMLAMLANVYLGIAFDFKYLTWKTTKKALVGVILIWFINFLVLFLFAIPLLDIYLHDAHVNEYRAEIFKQGKSFAAAFVILFILCGGVLGFLTTRAIKKKKKKRAEMNLPPLQAEARLKCDIKAITTIAITIATYFLCYVPSIVVAVVGLKHENQAEHWFGFTAWYCLYISSTVNPIIYYLRTNRFRSAFKQFFRDPLGSSDFKEKPSGRGTGVKRKANITISRKRDGIKAKSGKTLEVQFDENQKHSGEKNNEMVILAINNLSTRDPCISLLSFIWRK
ncbi:hypothetical protein ACROYT_G008372 [Oculina patagonica]